MPRYTRNFIPGGTFFFTVVTEERRPWLCTDAARIALREAIQHVQLKLPFTIDAWVLLPDHIHCIWTLPPGDADFATRWRLIKTHVTKICAPVLNRETVNASRVKRHEQGLWQRRFWEHTIRDEDDLAAHCDYIHYNPVKHGLSTSPQEWPHSTFHRFLQASIYPDDWGCREPLVAEGVGKE